MSFVPVVTTPPTPSPKAKELSRRLTDTIDHFRQEDPTISPAEIRQAVSLAMPGASTEGAKVALVLGALCLLFGIAVFFYLYL